MNQSLVSKLANYEFWLTQGQKSAQTGCYSEALSSLKKALELQPSSCQAWMCLGRVLTQLDCYEEAIRSFEQATHVYTVEDSSVY